MYLLSGSQLANLNIHRRNPQLYYLAPGQKKSSVMKAIAKTTWGKDKDTLMTTYKAIICPIAYYGAAMYTYTTAQ